MSRNPVYMALVHYPVVNRKGEQIATAVTNLDVHDGGRLAATYDVKRYFLVTPIEEQQSLVLRIHEHWTTGPGGQRNPKRMLAMSRVEPSASLEDACEAIAAIEGQRPLLIGTSARPRPEEAISYAALRQEIFHPHEDTPPMLLVFGTGWGIAKDIVPALDRMLPPISGGQEYNHLSVRAAIAITIDRLLSDLDPPLPTSPE